MLLLRTTVHAAKALLQVLCSAVIEPGSLFEDIIPVVGLLQHDSL